MAKKTLKKVPHIFSEMIFSPKLKQIYGQNIFSYLENPIIDNIYISFLKNQALSFAVGNSKLPVKLDENHIFDLGSDSINDSYTSGLINIKQNPKLLKFILEKIGGDLKAENITAAFVTNRHFDVEMSKAVCAPTIGYKQSIIITSHNLKSKSLKNYQIGIHILDSNGFSTVYYKIFSKLSIEKRGRQKRATDEFPNNEFRFMNMFNQTLVLKNDTWVWQRIKEIGRIQQSNIKKNLLSASNFFIVGEIEGERIAEGYSKKILPFIKYNQFSYYSNLDMKYFSAPNLLKVGFIKPIGTRIRPGIQMISVDTSSDTENQSEPDVTELFGPCGTNATEVTGCCEFQSQNTCQNCCASWYDAKITELINLTNKAHDICWAMGPYKSDCDLAVDIAIIILVCYYYNIASHCLENCNVRISKHI